MSSAIRIMQLLAKDKELSLADVAETFETLLDDSIKEQTVDKLDRAFAKLRQDPQMRIEPLCADVFEKVSARVRSDLKCSQATKLSKEQLGKFIGLCERYKQDKVRGPFDSSTQDVAVGTDFGDPQTIAYRPPYLHAGIDYRVPAGSEVKAITGGLVRIQKPIKNPLEYTWIEVEEQNQPGVAKKIWSYQHIDLRSIPDEIYQKSLSGEPIEAGEFLGKVSAWFMADKTDNKPFDHLHLELLVGNRISNPRFALDIPDITSPKICTLGFVPNGSREAFTGEVPKINGQVDVVVEAFDLCQKYFQDTSGNKRVSDNPFKLGVSQVDLRVVSVASGQTVFESQGKIESFPLLQGKTSASGVSDTDYYRMAEMSAIEAAADVFQPTMRYKLPEDKVSTWWNTRGDYTSRVALYVPTNVKEGVWDRNCSWDTAKCDNGFYEVTVTVKDFDGNKATETRRVEVANKKE